MLKGVNVGQLKDKIVGLIKLKGPSLPVQIARGINVELLFTSAFLSELYNEKRIKMSGMRVGSSPLYYLEGQESMLENFIEHLNVREREAFLALKKDKIFEDDALTPVMRVALRAIKDFAVPLKIKVGENDKIFWKHFLLKDEDVRAGIQQILMPSVEKKDETRIVQKPVVVQQALEVEDKENSGNYATFRPEFSNRQFGKTDNIINQIIHKKDKGEKSVEERKEVGEIREKRREIKKEKKIKSQDSLFAKKIRDYLSVKDIEILESIFESKKEFYARIRIDMIFGKQEFFMVARDKKVVNEADLALALQQAQSSKMPLLFVSNGKLNKKAEEHFKDWKGLIKIEKVRF